jgi:hypothetical protein
LWLLRLLLRLWLLLLLLQRLHGWPLLLLLLLLLCNATHCLLVVLLWHQHGL